jgi:chromosome segregation ATPase
MSDNRMTRDEYDALMSSESGGQVGSYAADEITSAGNPQLAGTWRRVTRLEAEVARMQAVIDKNHSALFLEAIQRACDERMVDLKMELRDQRARAERAEAALADLEKKRPACWEQERVAMSAMIGWHDQAMVQLEGELECALDKLNKTRDQLERTKAALKWWMKERNRIRAVGSRLAHALFKIRTRFDAKDEIVANLTCLVDEWDTTARRTKGRDGENTKKPATEAAG